MAKLTTNWNEVRQSMVDDISLELNVIKKKALDDIENRLLDEGLNPNKLSKTENSVVFITDNDQEFEEGKIYFNKVHDEISDDTWLELL